MESNTTQPTTRDVKWFCILFKKERNRKKKNPEMWQPQDGLIVSPPALMNRQLPESDVPSLVALSSRRYDVIR